MFPSPLSSASRRTCTGCVHPCAGSVPELAGYTRSGLRFRNRCIGGRNVIESHTWDNLQSLRSPSAAGFRTARSGKLCACQASEPDADRKCPFLRAVLRLTASASRRPSPDIRAVDTYDPTRPSPNGLTLSLSAAFSASMKGRNACSYRGLQSGRIVIPYSGCYHPIS